LPSSLDQNIASLPNGTNTLSAWVKTSTAGGQLDAKGLGGPVEPRFLGPQPDISVVEEMFSPETVGRSAGGIVQIDEWRSRYAAHDP
jgi:hypothetical protein